MTLKFMCITFKTLFLELNYEYIASNNYYDFCREAEKAKEENRFFHFLRCGKNQRYGSEGIYNYGTEVANLNLGRRTIRKMDYWSPVSSKHYNYAARMLELCYDFYEHPRSDAHVQNLSYWGRT